MTSNNSTSFNYEAPILLIGTGTLLAVTVLLSKLAAEAGAPMLWFVSLSMGIAGLLLTLFSLNQRGFKKAAPRSLTLYALGAGGLLALPNAIAYSAVAHVGAGMVSLAYAFPVLFTYLLAVTLRLEQLCSYRIAGVSLAFLGGLLIVRATSSDPGVVAGSLWVLLVALVPILLAMGNLFRSHYWPKGAKPLPLAGLTFMTAGILIAPFAVLTQQQFELLFLYDNILLLLGLNIVAFTLQGIGFFRLQWVADAVYLSQLGNVAAAVGIPVSVLMLGEVFPNGFFLALPLVAAGVVFFQLGQKRAI